MTKEDYNHALKELQNKRKEFENEIKFVDDEINIIKKDYINRNAEFKIGDIVNYIPEKNNNIKYIIESINIKKGLFVYDCISPTNNFHRMDWVAPEENNLKLTEKAKE